MLMDAHLHGHPSAPTIRMTQALALPVLSLSLKKMSLLNICV
jgi:hypothetical protein